MTVERTTTRKMTTTNKGSLTLTTKSHGHHVLHVNNGSGDQREASSGETYLDDEALHNLCTLVTEALEEI